MPEILRRKVSLLREVLLGAWLGFWLLGLGGRVAMRGVALALGQPPLFSAGGTLTVVLAGAVSGAAGAVLYALSRAAAVRLAGARTWEPVLRLTLFAIVLSLVTARGLRGSPGPTAAFWLVVAAYGAALAIACRRDRAPPALDA